MQLDVDCSFRKVFVNLVKIVISLMKSVKFNNVSSMSLNEFLIFVFVASNANQLFDDKECGICMEFVENKGERFGLLCISSFVYTYSIVFQFIIN